MYIFIVAIILLLVFVILQVDSATIAQGDIIVVYDDNGNWYKVYVSSNNYSAHIIMGIVVAHMSATTTLDPTAYCIGSTVAVEYSQCIKWNWGVLNEVIKRMKIYCK